MSGGESRIFSAGLDCKFYIIYFNLVSEINDIINFKQHCDASQGALHFLDVIKKMQDAVTAIQECSHVVIAAVHGACIGAGIP